MGTSLLASGPIEAGPPSAASVVVTPNETGGRPRARDLGVPFDGTPGPLNAITDVGGVAVKHVTINEGSGPLVVGEGPIRTGLTAMLPRPDGLPIYAARYDLNGVGELTGAHVIDEIGYVIGPIITTNTNSVGTVRDAAIAWAYRQFGPELGFFFSEAVVGECHDGTFNDIIGRHVHDDHVDAALDALAATGGASEPVPEGNVGGGTGMICHEFKGGIGTSSRRLPADAGGFIVGVLVQANHGLRSTLTIAGVPVGREITDLLPEVDESPGSRAARSSSSSAPMRRCCPTSSIAWPAEAPSASASSAVAATTSPGTSASPSPPPTSSTSTCH